MVNPDPDRIEGRSEAATLGVREAKLLTSVGLWYNGAWFEIGPWWYNIGYQKPPAMGRLLGCRDVAWHTECDPVLERLQAAGLLEERYILRRKCKWVPTREGRELIGEYFEADLEPYTTRRLTKDTPLVGDWNEPLLHRTGVEIMFTALQLQGWLCSPYPGKCGQTHPDIAAQDIATMADASESAANHLVVEVLTTRYDPTIPEQKYTAFANDPHRESLWIFENRAHAFRTLNRLHCSADVDCDLVNAPYQNPENYAISVGNEYIRRSRTSATHSCPGIDKIGTITGWYEEWLDEETLRNTVYKRADGFEDNGHGPHSHVETV